MRPYHAEVTVTVGVEEICKAIVNVAGEPHILFVISDCCCYTLYIHWLRLFPTGYTL